MTPRRKLLLALIGAALVLLFVAAVADPGGSRQGKPGSAQGGLAGLLGRFAGTAGAVRAADITAKCRQPDGVFLVGFGGCVLDVAAGGTGVRTVRLRTDQALTVRSRAPRNDFTVTARLGPGGDARVAVDERGGPIVLLCTGGGGAGTCAVTLVGSG